MENKTALQAKETRVASHGSKLRRGLRWMLVGVAVIAVGVVVWLLSIEVAMWRGAANIQARDHQRAVRWLEKAEFLSPERAELHFLLARCYRRLEQFDQVEHHLRRAHELGWDVHQLEREQWIALAQTGQFDNMSEHWAELFEDVGSDGPEISKAYTTMCLARFQFREADQVLSAWEKDFPADAEPHVMRGRLASTNLNWKGAADHYRNALAMTPGRTDAQLGLAKALINLGQVEQSREILALVVEQNPQNWDARLALAQCQFKLEQHVEARRELEKVLAAEPENVDALLEASNIELATNNHRAAAKYVLKALQLKPENREIAYAAARTLQAEGDHEQARKLFKFVDEATEPLIRLKKLISRLLSEPDNLELRFEVAAITWRYKSREEGARWLLSLLNFDPHHQPTHAALAQHYQSLGEERKATYHRQLAGLATDIPPAPDDDTPGNSAARQPSSQPSSSQPSSSQPSSSQPSSSQP